MTRGQFEDWNESEHAQEYYPQDESKLEEYLNTLRPAS